MLFAIGVALAAPPVAASAEGAPTGFGLGVVVGEPTALSAAYKGGGRTWIDAAIGWSFPREWMAFHADLLLTPATLASPDLGELRFPLYLGVGPRVRIDFDTYGDRDSVGVRVPFGMGLYHPSVPVEGFLELVPGIGIIPETEPYVDIGLGVRYYFGT